MAQSNAEVINTALNRSVVFIKVADAAFTVIVGSGVKLSVDLF